MDRRDLANLAGKVLSLSEAPQTEVIVSYARKELVRMAVNRIVHGPVDIEKVSVSVRVRDGAKMGYASTEVLTDKALAEMVDMAYFVMKNSPPIDVTWDLPGADASIEVDETDAGDIWNEDTKREIVSTLFDKAESLGVEGHGTVVTDTMKVLVANSEGLMSYAGGTTGSAKLMLRKDRKEVQDILAFTSGYTPDFHASIEKLASNISKMDKLGELPPGDYNVVLGPQAVMELLSTMTYFSFTADAASKGMSYVYAQKGKKLLPDYITVMDNVNDTRFSSLPFDFEGIKRRPVYFVMRGTMGTVVNNLYFAKKLGEQPTGHALPFDGYFSPGAYPLNIVMSGGEKISEEIMKDLDEYIYIEGFHYVNAFLDPFNVRATGLTRYGTYRMKGTEVVEVYDNARFLQSFWEALKNVRAVSSDTYLLPHPYFAGGGFIVPYLYIENFHIGA
ncbi:hypothetical protein GM182_07760 [bacterium 3DAC]|nr:hypothetical protein GM182_07760 [bacterium 3DAC]